jgi:hypothetical protein
VAASGEWQSRHLVRFIVPPRFDCAFETGLGGKGRGRGAIH